MKSNYALYSATEVASFLLSHQDGIDFKQGHELLCGCIIAKHIMTGDERNVGIGFRLSDSQVNLPINRPSLSELLTEFKVDDRDVDVIVGTDFWLSPIQVTRLVETGRGSTPEDRLKTLLTKKMKIQSDSKLMLAILMDETFELVYDNIRSFIRDINIPYGRIYLIGQTGNTPKQGEFNCMEIFPELTISTVVTVFK